MASPVAPRQALTALVVGERSDVLTWFAERAAPTTAEHAIGIDELHRDYAAWCRSMPLPTARFQADLDRVRELPELAGKVRKFGDRYYGITLVGGPGA
jgi:hypothetical protein